MLMLHVYKHFKKKKKERETIFKIMHPNTVYFSKLLYMPTLWLMHDLLLNVYCLL